ncbi:bifunctional aspartate kinase/homoserine dehydrogenase I [Leeuwenhoekiella aequorea]|uniref:Aspartate kinase n=1 Tax=Leeuwenhoekiella aequorea TaxID=283736 RepID=A0A4Q0P4I5_9FLAO|nr:bifunctional aspartate kinase/homoserine dehydrogenase I [Leeuwenhoekiella aequorea]RXG21483.1 aspartate kinase [Leeuwenhoekiella aequorea]
MLHKLEVLNFTTQSGYQLNLPLSYETFGQELGTAPVILVNHALTGNSHVSGDEGWWNEIIGENKCIDTNTYSILSFNIPGNGYDGFLIENYKDFVAQDVARSFLEGLKLLNINELFAIIGGSLGGGIAWEMIALQPDITKHLIPVASDWKSTDWLIANCQIQEQILKNSSQPVHDARMHAMLCYRTPESFKNKFQRSTNEDLKIFNVESWLDHHGHKLKDRFQVAAYRLMNQLLKTIDVTRGREEFNEILSKVEANIHIIGVDSDLFFTPAENRETYKQLAQHKNNVTYGEINSVHGHDAFLIEFEQLEQLLYPVFKEDSAKLKILKFGGKSLANGNGLTTVLDIIQSKVANNERIAVVLSARGGATDELEAILEAAASGLAIEHRFEAFETYQQHDFDVDLSSEFSELKRLFEGVTLLGDYSRRVKDEVLSFGELISVKTVTHLLQKQGVNAHFADTRKLIITNGTFGNAQPNDTRSREQVVKHFAKYNGNTVHVVTGFIASNEDNQTTTLGRNGSNYTASLLANYLDAGELQNYTHVDGIFTANPDMVPDAQKIERLTYSEANELANFGTSVLHAKTIIPLIEKNIPLRILNTFNADDTGTLITAQTEQEGIKSLSVLSEMALINLEGRGLLGKVGVDARIFRALGNSGVSVSIIAQGSSERGIGLVVESKQAQQAIAALRFEFEADFQNQDVNRIEIIDEVAVISIIGQDLSTFHKPYSELIKNGIVPLLFNNTVTGRNVSVVVRKPQLNKAINVVHGEIFGIAKKINVAIFGQGLVGGTLINQILASAATIQERKGISLNIFAIANSKKIVLDKNGVTEDWKSHFDTHAVDGGFQEVIAFAKANHLANLIAIDNTASAEFIANYIDLAKNGFDLVSSNKIANTIGFDFYQKLRRVLDENQKRYLYETNVGAGLPLIDTIRLLHLSGDNITRIKGVFSGSLSYLFNTFSIEDRSFSNVLQEAIDKGFTEPDPREDLGGNDVGRKLLILARELDLHKELSDVNIENLIPDHLRDGSASDFLGSLKELDAVFESRKKALKEDEVLRYVGDLYGDLSKEDGGTLEVKLVTVSKNSALGQVKGSDSIFEIYTESYGENPLVIQGAGAGAAVTARGVFGDILKLAERNN